MNTACAELLERYYSQHPTSSRLGVTAGYFCADEVNANRCATLIDQGIKTASCSMAYWYEQNLEPWPEIDQLHIVTNWNDQPVCIIKITDITLCRFVDVTVDFA